MRYIWLFGENLGETANNNSYYFWKHIIETYDEIDTYLILKKTEENTLLYKGMSERAKKYVIWRNSMEHIRLYFLADLLFVSLSYRDVQPDHICGKAYQPMPTQPLIYLQHGTIAMKKLGYTPDYANNSMLRFIYYNPKIKEQLMEVNKFRDYQTYFGIYPPRYMELVRRYKNLPKKQEKSFLWFVTWREYFGNNAATQRFLKNIKRTIQDEKLQQYLKASNSKINICLHRLFKPEQVEIVKSVLKELSNVKLIDAKDIDVMDQIVENDILITDYSSIAFDFTALKKPVIMYQPDRVEYLKKRSMYCTYEEIEEASISERSELIDCIVNESYGLNPFFTERMPEECDHEEILAGKYIDRMYQDFLQMQKETIAFLGYDFSGIGGTVSATKALMEGLLEKGKLVRIFTLKRVKKGNLPPGVPIHPMYNSYKKSLSEKLKVAMYFPKYHLRYLKDDPAAEHIRPIAGHGMDFWMKNIHAKTVVSTRESIHFFLNECTSEFVKNRIYYFHTSSNVVDELFPGVIGKLNELNLEKAIFVTEKNRQNLKDELGFENYQDYCVIGNSLDSSRCVERDAICAIEEKEMYHVVFLLRISKERKEDLQSLMNFAQYLKDNQIKNIVVNVYGTGDYLDTLLDEIDEQELSKYICYCGSTDNVKGAIAKNDAVVDFSKIQSFGMSYIEGILNGKMVFCPHNEGSNEVMCDIPEAYFETYEELANKILSLSQMPLETLQEYYDIIASKYSRSVTTDKFLEFIDK